MVHADGVSDVDVADLVVEDAVVGVEQKDAAGCSPSYPPCWETGGIGIAGGSHRPTANSIGSDNWHNSRPSLD